MTSGWSLRWEMRTFGRGAARSPDKAPSLETVVPAKARYPVQRMARPRPQGCLSGRVVRWQAWVLDSGLRGNDERMELALEMRMFGRGSGTVAR